MRCLEVHTVPLWEDPDGRRRPALAPEPVTPPVVGWVNVIVVEIDGETYRLMHAGGPC